VDAGVSGFIGASSEELTALVPETCALDRRRVRDHACGRFSHNKMVDDYLALYQGRNIGSGSS
jgi:hypothetical protein